MTQTIAAAHTSTRVAALDVLRGIAIIGTLASNIWIFTSLVGGEEASAREWLASFSHWIPNGKFLGLLTIMFGIGLEIQRQSALRAGKKWPGKYPIRAGLLFLDGLINYIFVVQFDVLRAYALTGLIVAFLLLTSERVQWWLIGIFLTLHFSLMAWMSTFTDGSFMKKPEGAMEVLTEAEYAAMSEPGYWQDVLFTLQTIGNGFNVHSEFFTIVIMGIALFLLGAKLYRIGIFTPERRRLRRWLIGVGFLVALPIDALLTFTDFAGGMFSGYARYGAAAGVALGILALVAEFYERRTPGTVGKHLAYVGKMALSGYLLQNIIGVVLDRTLFRTEAFMGVSNVLITYVSFVAITALLIIFSKLWLRRFSRGPFELVWNWMYRKLARD